MYPPLPTARLDPLYAFYGFSTSPRERAHGSLTPGTWRSAPAACATSASSSSTSANATTRPAPRGLYPLPPGSAALASLDERRTAARRAGARVRLRALRGVPPAGCALAHDADDLSGEEDELEIRRRSIDMFGSKFLMPIGRTTTQIEMEAVPSPTPSDGEHQQEDRNGVATPLGTPQPDDDPDDEVDLDASIEDRDAATGSEGEGEGYSDEYGYAQEEHGHGVDGEAEGDADGRSTEYDSNESLMRNMDRSVSDAGSDFDDE